MAWGVVQDLGIPMLAVIARQAPSALSASTARQTSVPTFGPMTSIFGKPGVLMLGPRGADNSAAPLR